MTPELERHIRLARHHIYGVPLDPDTIIEEKAASNIEEVKRFLRGKMGLDVWFELLACGEAMWTPEGCSVEFEVDQSRFLLTQHVNTFRLIERARKHDIPLQVLKNDDDDFADKLLVAIGDALKEKGGSERTQ